MPSFSAWASVVTNSRIRLPLGHRSVHGGLFSTYFGRNGDWSRPAPPENDGFEKDFFFTTFFFFFTTFFAAMSHLSRPIVDCWL